MASNQEARTNDEVHDESQCPASLIAQIPWLPQRVQSIPFEQSDFYKIFFACNKLSPHEVEKRLAMRQILAQAFPFFLPSRYHMMDAVEMHKRAASPGSYWTNAIHFVHTCSDFDTMPYFNINFTIESSRHNMKQSSISGGECKFKDFQQGGPEQCESAAEFLLEPWVLLQLPFQPALLHQWSVALLAESLKFARKLAEIGNKGYSAQCSVLFDYLIELHGDIYNCSQKFLKTFFNIYCAEPLQTITPKMDAIGIEFEFIDVLQNALSVLVFIQSEECTEMLNFIKRESWHEYTHPAKLETKRAINFPCLYSEDKPNLNVYDEAYWFLPVAGTLCNVYDVEVFKIFPTYPDVFAEILPDNEDHSDAVKEFVREAVLKNGHLKGLQDAEIFIHGLKKFMSPADYYLLEFHVCFLDHLKGSDCRAPQVDRGGVLLDILSLQMDFHAETSIGIITNLVWRAAKDFDHGVYLNSDSIEAPSNVTVEELEDKINNLSDTKVDWTWSSLFSRVQDTQIGDGKNLRKVTDFSWDVEYLMDHFMRKIRLMTLRIYTQQCKKKDGQERRQFNPECNYIQYILPCFVAMIMDVDKDPQLDSKTKEDYKRFVGELINSFEGKAQCNLLGVDKHRSVNSAPFYAVRLKMRYVKVVNALQSLFKTSNSMQLVLSKFEYISMSFGAFLMRAGCSPYAKLNDEKLGMLEPVGSTNQLNSLLHRLVDCFVKVGCSSIKAEQPQFIEYVLTFELLALETHNIAKIVVFFETIKDKAELAKLKNLIPKSVLKGGAQLTAPQLYGILIFVVWREKFSIGQFFSIFQLGILFPLDPFQSITQNFLFNEWWKIKCRFAPFLRGPHSEDLSLIPIKVALRNACCRPLLKSLNTDRTRIKMKQPGEVTFNPIQHCRWCGLVNAHPFRLCPECKDEPDYPHPNYFCSEKCETVALDKCHMEEHAKFIMERLGLGN